MAEISRCKPLLGTYVELDLVSKSLSDSALLSLSQRAFDEIQGIHSLMSFHESNSDVSSINQFAHKTTVKISKDTRRVLEFALHLSEQSDGVFDISVAPFLVNQGLLPDPKIAIDDKASWQDICLNNDGVTLTKPLLIDLGGVAKGYAVDKAYSALQEAINEDGLEVRINAGGDLKMSHWEEQPLRINTPFSNNLYRDILMLDSAAATSGDYLLDGKHAIISKKNNSTNGSFTSPRPLSVSIFSESCMVSDSLTKLAFLTSNPRKILEHYNAKAFIIQSDKTNCWIN